MASQYQYPEQDPTQISTFGAQVFWADAGEEEVDYSPEALDYQQPTSSSSSSHKESRSSKSSSRHHKRGKESKSSYQSGSDTERESPRGGSSKMSGSSRSAKHQQPSSKREKAPKPSKKTTDDWSEVTDPEERRRIQNKIAQRKFSKSAGFLLLFFFITYQD